MHPVIQSRTRYLLSAGALSVSLLLSLSIFFILRRLEDQNALASFRGVAHERFDALEINVRLTLDNLLALEGFFDASQRVERREFARFTSKLLDHDQTIQALEWIPRVPARLRSSYESAARRDGLASFQIADRSPEGAMRKAPARDEHFPVFFVEPFEGNEKALGFDLASDPTRREALLHSADSGQMTATSRVVLVQEQGDQYGFLVFRPCYRDPSDPSSLQRRRDALAGFVLGVFRMKDVVESKTSGGAAAFGLGLAVFDREAKAGQRLLYPKGANFDGIRDLPKGPVEAYTISVAGRTWEVAAYPLPHAFPPVRWSSWSILVAELIVVACSVTYLYLMLSRRHAIEQTVAERTDALRAAVEQRELAKRTAQKSERRYRKLLEVSPDAILLGRNGVILMANEAAVKLFRVGSAKELIGCRLEDFVSPDARADVQQVGRNPFSTEMQLPQRETRLVCGKAAVDVEIAAASYLDDEGTTFQSVIRDITGRKEAEKALRDSEEKFRQLAENINEVFFVLTPGADQALYVSPGFERIWGLSSDTVYGNPMVWQESIHPDDLEQTRLMAARRPVGEPVEFEYRIRTPDGLEKWVRSRSFPVLDQGGQLIRIVGIAEEITEQKRYEAELIRAREGAEAANRTKSLFLATMSHELRTPLNAILGFAELLELEMADGGVHAWQADIQNIRRAGTHLLALISDVMDFSRIEAGKLELQPDNFDIAALVDEIAAGVEPLAARNRVKVLVECEPAILYGDRVRIGQCLFNLLGNACKFTHDGQVVVNARLESGSGGEWYALRVTDTGIGIRPQDLEKLFCYFTQLEASKARKYGGTGLGLAISRKLSRLMGGDITVESSLGQGSTFTLRFPAGTAPAPTVGKPAGSLIHEMAAG